MPEHTMDLLGAGMNLGGGGAAFIVTIQGVLLAMNEHPIVRTLKELNVFQPLLVYFGAAVRWCFYLLLLSAACFFMPVDPKGAALPDWARWVFAVWIGTGVTAACTCLRIAKLFSKIQTGS